MPTASTPRCCSDRLPVRGCGGRFRTTMPTRPSCARTTTGWPRTTRSADPSASSAFVIPWTNVDDAIEELEHCAKIGTKPSLGTFPSGKGYPTAEDDRFWAAAVDSGLAITVHVEFDRNGSRGGPLATRANPESCAPSVASPAWSSKSPTRSSAAWAPSTPCSSCSRAFLIASTLRIFFAENQIGWIPFFLEMADVRYDRHSGWAERLLDVKPLAGRRASTSANTATGASSTTKWAWSCAATWASIASSGRRTSHTRNPIGRTPWRCSRTAW